MIAMFDKHRSSKKGGLETQESNTVAQSAAEKNVLSTSRVTAMIGPTVKIKGDVFSDENLIIEGNVEGTVTANSHEVKVGKSGHVKADISAKVVQVDGTIQGNISGKEKVIISNTGNVQGNIDSPRVSLEDGAKFKGSIDMDPGDQVTAELPLTSVGQKKDGQQGAKVDNQDDTAFSQKS